MRTYDINADESLSTFLYNQRRRIRDTLNGPTRKDGQWVLTHKNGAETKQVELDAEPEGLFVNQVNS